MVHSNSSPDDELNESDDSGTDVSRRSFLKTTGAVTGAAALGLGTGASDIAAASDGATGEFFNWRAREASHAWERGYRGRVDRTIALTDSGIDARHPDTGPWNGVRAMQRNGELTLTKPEENNLELVELDGGEHYTGTIGPGTFVNPVTERHQFTAHADAERLEASLSWSPVEEEDLEFYVEDADGNRVAGAATANNPETLSASVAGGADYVFVVETWANVAADYEINGSYHRYEGEFTAFTGSPFDNVDGDNITSDTPKVVGWYNETTRYGDYEKPRDPNGHGTHVSSIMGGSGRASAVDQATVETDEPRTTLALGDTITYKVTAEAGTGVYAAAYGDALEITIEAPDGSTLAESTIGIDDSSEWDNNVTDTPTVHDSGDATYKVHVTAYDGDLTTTARVERVQVGALLNEDVTIGDRTTAGDLSVHAGIAPNSSLVGLQGLSGPTTDLGNDANWFADTFNMRAVNMSWGYVGGLPLGAAGGLLTSNPATIKNIAGAGILVSAAAGNAGTPANGNGAPGVADEAISVVATGALDGIAGYSSGGLAAYDEDTNTVYRKPDVTAPGGTVTDLARAAEIGDPDTSEENQPPIRDYTGKAGTSMASPYVTGIAGLVSEAMETGKAPKAIRLPEPADTGMDDVLKLKQAILATASETALTAAPYHRAHVPTYDFGARDPYEGFGRANPGAAIDAVTRELSGTTTETVGLDIPETERAIAGYVTAGPGTVSVDVAFSHLHGANSGAAKGNPHVDLFVYDAANPGSNGDPNVLARAQGLEGDASVSVSLDREQGDRVLYVVAKLVNVPGVVNGYDVRATFDLTVNVDDDGLIANGQRQDDASVFTGGQTNQIDVTVDPSANAVVRDVIPAEWNVLVDYSDDVKEVVEDDGENVKYVYFNGTAKAGTETTYTYFAEAPDTYEESGEYLFGPVNAQATNDTTWVSISGTTDTNVVLGQST